MVNKEEINEWMKELAEHIRLRIQGYNIVCV